LDVGVDRAFIACVGGWTNANGSAITGIATVLLAAITVLLAIIAKEQSGIAAEQSKTSRAQLRAYVLADFAQIDHTDLNTSPEVTIYIKNYGETPARNFFVGFPPLTVIRRRDADRLLKTTTREQHRSQPASHEVIGPGAVRPFKARYISRRRSNVLRLGRPKMQRLLNGSHAIYIYGVVFYEDVFGVEHESTIRLFSNIRTPPNTLTTMVPDDGGNEAT
jgi:hypothetical protein